MGWEWRVFFPTDSLTSGFTLESLGLRPVKSSKVRTDIYWAFLPTFGIKQRSEKVAVEVKVRAHTEGEGDNILEDWDKTTVRSGTPADVAAFVRRHGAGEAEAAEWLLAEGAPFKFPMVKHRRYFDTPTESLKCDAEETNLEIGEQTWRTISFEGKRKHIRAALEAYGASIPREINGGYPTLVHHLHTTRASRK